MSEHAEFGRSGNQANAAGSGGGRKKRKNGLLSRLKKFGSQGKLGRGFEINADTYNYFLRIFELCNKNEFETEEEKGTARLRLLRNQSGLLLKD